jgi:hypothetical protein
MIVRPDFVALHDVRAANVRVMLVTGEADLEAATSLDISEYLYDPTPITFEGDETAIYLENGDAMRETPEEAVARINAELEAWEDMSTAARWTPPPEDDDEAQAELSSIRPIPDVPLTRFPRSSEVGDWLENVCEDLHLTEWQRTMLEHYYAFPVMSPSAAIIVTDV